MVVVQAKMYQVMTLLFWNGCAIMISVHVDRNFHVVYSCVVIIFMTFRGCFDISVYIMLWLYLYMSWLYMYVLWMYIHVVVVYILYGDHLLRYLMVVLCCDIIRIMPPRKTKTTPTAPAIERHNLL